MGTKKPAFYKKPFFGQLGHDPAILRAAADYLDEWSEIERAREEEGCRADELGEGD